MSVARMRMCKTLFANFNDCIPNQDESDSYLLGFQSNGYVFQEWSGFWESDSRKQNQTKQNKEQMNYEEFK